MCGPTAGVGWAVAGVRAGRGAGGAGRDSKGWGAQNTRLASLRPRGLPALAPVRFFFFLGFTGAGVGLDCLGGACSPGKLWEKGERGACKRKEARQEKKKGVDRTDE